jgi:hypothetical protein
MIWQACWRQVEETMEVLVEGPESFYKGYLH